MILAQEKETYIIWVRLVIEMYLAYAISNTLNGRSGSCSSRRSHFGK